MSRPAMILMYCCTAFIAAALTHPALAAAINNPGFEDGWSGWMEIDKDGKSVAISGDSHEGEASAKITSQAGSFAQAITVKPRTDYVLSAWVTGAGIVGVKIGKQLVFERQGKTRSWKEVQVAFNSGDHQQVAVFTQYNGRKGLFDDFSIIEAKGEQNDASISLGDGGLSPDFPPGRNFELNDWYLNTPEDGGDGRAKRIPERELVNGYQNKPYFYTAEDGGMVFRTTIGGKKTSKNTRYTRTELREMLRRGDTSIRTKSEAGEPNKNNWVFSTAPGRAQKLAGGIDGTLKATLAVNHVTTTGSARDIGQVIIGQIHAGHDEPARLHYRKLPGNERGSIYVAHEISGGDDEWYEILGSRSDTAKDPLDGIALNEKFSYEIAAKGHELKVTISKEGVILGSITIDMTNSGYDVENDYMYFKAGVYTQNDSGDPSDFDQATFYFLENTH
ncbi:MAG: polysaccharide lyase family 7 protein [Gammaproteobacteria bacterium]|nr:polysaccharide lyase family 7 protein [Gammaproteobacteria bacterium]